MTGRGRATNCWKARSAIPNRGCKEMWVAQNLPLQWKLQVVRKTARISSAAWLSGGGASKSAAQPYAGET
eukprot:14921602-Alexandrium_andersonii.AAC.1